MFFLTSQKTLNFRHVTVRIGAPANFKDVNCDIIPNSSLVKLYKSADFIHKYPSSLIICKSPLSNIMNTLTILKLHLRRQLPFVSRKSRNCCYHAILYYLLYKTFLTYHYHLLLNGTFCFGVFCCCCCFGMKVILHQFYLY